MLTKLVILGKSDATIAMIMDNLESNDIFPNIDIVNNLNLIIENSFDNPKFKWKFINELLDENESMILGVSSPIVKKTILSKFNYKTFTFLNIIHNTASISKTIKLGKGNVINNHVSVSAHTQIGDFVNINRNVGIGHHNIINNFVTINPSVSVGGNVIIGEGSTLGIGAVIIDHITIGKNTIIGAGAVVTKNIPNNVIAYGNPCKIIRTNET